MKNLRKRVFMVILSMIMVLGMSMTAFADEQSTEHSHTITIMETNYGHKFEAYQIFEGKVEELNGKYVLANIKWGDSVDVTNGRSWTYKDDNGTEQTESLTLFAALQNQFINPDYYHLYIGCEDAEDVVGVLSENVTVEHVRVFTEIIDDYLKNPAVAKAYQKTGESDGKPIYKEVINKEDKITNYQIRDLSDGYYLIKENNDNDIDPETHTEYILQLVQDVTVEPKDGSVGVEKKIIEGDTPVDVCSNNIGDIVDFHINGSLPDNYSDYHTFAYEFVDNMSPGLTVYRIPVVDVNGNPVLDGEGNPTYHKPEDSIKVYTVNGDTKKEIVNPATGTPYFAVSIDENENGTEIKVTFEDLKTLTDSSDYTVRSTTGIRVEYKAVVNEKAQIGNYGNPNKVYVNFSRSPYTDTKGQTVEDEVYVFTFQLNVDKIDDSTNPVTKLEGVEFVLARERSGHSQYAIVKDGKISGWTNWIDLEVLKDYVENILKLTDDAFDKKVEELQKKIGVATPLVTDGEGRVNVKGLDLDTYWLIETKALSGYNTVAPIKFTISADYGVDTENGNKPIYTNLKITLDGKQPQDGDASDGSVGTTVVNNPGHELPSTGGIGTTIFYIVGGVLFAAALVLLITKKRMSR